MSITQTFTVTMTGSSGAKKYVIDGVQQPRLNLVRGGLYVFDVSDSSNTDQALRFSTTSNGTHAGGSIYTTGVSQNLGGGNPGAKIEFQVASDAPSSLHYFDINAGTNAGGEINTLLGSTYGTLPWNVNSWGSDEIIVSLSSPGATTALGTPQSFNVEGWGRQQYGNSGWGVEFSVEPTGLSITSSQGTATGFPQTIVEMTGVSSTVSVGAVTAADVVGVSGLSITSAIGDLASVGTLVGWGRNGWGEEPYGDSVNKVVVLALGSQITSGVGSISPADVMGLTGVSSTSSVGSPTIIGSVAFSLTGVSATASVGSLEVSSSPLVTPSGVSATTSVGSLAPADVMGLTGVSATASIGSVEINSSPIIVPTGQSATLSVGSITPADVMGLTGVSATVSVGSITPTDVMGLTGQSVTVSVGILSIEAYADVDTGSNTSYSDVSTGSNDTYSDVATGSNTSYSDAA